jgi:beta-galactosidase
MFHTSDLPFGYPSTTRSKLRLNVGWRFHLGDLPQAAQADFDDSAWETVHLPHTLKLTSLNLDGCQDDKTQPTFHREVGWYRRTFTVDPDPEHLVFLEFEGAHQVTDCWVNGLYVGEHAIGGYTPFHFNVTDFVNRDGPNVVALRVDNTKNPDVPPDPGPFDYIKFSGLYREVYLVQTGRLYIPFAWESRTAGVTITTPTVKTDCATISVQTLVRNRYDEPQTCTLRTRVIDAEGVVVLKMVSEAEIPAQSDHLFSQVDGLDGNAHLWSCDDPYLYRVHSLVLDEDTPVDGLENPLGIRRFELREDGFLLNGQYLKLIGVNRHQHYAYIGDALPKSLHYKDALQFKQAGLNVIRLAHYPHDNAFIEACDELGILVYEEAPTWIDFGGEMWNCNLEEALRRAVRNHRNHPSIFAWGGGINHRGTFEPLHYAAKEEDPTRWTGSNYAPWTGAQHASICDFYSNMDYRDLPDPDEHMFAVEHGISRDGERAQILVSRYKGDPYRFGMAAWTAHAYYTFHHQTGGSRNRTRGGMMDIFRIPRPVYYWYQSELTDDPMVYLADEWREGITRMRVFSNCDEVELLVNGVSLGVRKPDTDPLKANLKRPPFSFPVVWQPGKVEARGWLDGVLRVACSVRTPETPAGIELTVDLEGRSLTSDGSDIVVAYARVVDANGTTVTDYDGLVEFVVRGPASIVGGPEIGSNPMECFDGIAPVLVRAGLEAGTITLTAQAEGLAPASATFESRPAVADAIAAAAKPIYDLPGVRVDVGGEKQHVQYSWTPWTGASDVGESLDLPELGTVTVRPGVGDGLVWRGEANVPGPLGFVAEDGVCALGVLFLEFAGLQAGTYRLRTTHHGPSSDTDHMDPLHDKEHEADISKLPPAVCLDVAVQGETVAAFVPQGAGRRVPRSGPTCVELTFEANGADAVKVRFAATGGEGSVWLNGLELQRCPPQG